MKKIIKVVWSVVFWALATALIAVHSEGWIVEIAADIIGSLALLILGAIIFDDNE